MNIEAFKPPYKVYANVEINTIKAVIHSSVPDIKLIRTATAVISAHKKMNI